MRYSKEHKLATHARIVKKASVRLREKGAYGMGVADLMKEAGLTHGGFYAHFESREALVAEAFSFALDGSITRWNDLAGEDAPADRLVAIIDGYLSTRHRDAQGHGCALPSLGADIARESPKTRKVAAAKVEQLIDAMAAQFDDLPSKAARRKAMAAMSTMVGALLLSRVTGQGEVSDDILDAARRVTLENVVERPVAPANVRSNTRAKRRPTEKKAAARRLSAASRH